MENNSPSFQPVSNNNPNYSGSSPQVMVNGSIEEPPVAPKPKSKKMLVIFAVLFVVSVAVSAGIFFWQSNIVKSKEKSISQLQQNLDKSLNDYKNLSAITSLP